jgi:hypothetical protein
MILPPMNNSTLPMPAPSLLAHALRQLWNLALRGRSISSLMVALFLQFAPLVRTIEPAVTGLLQPVFILLRWATAATAIAGGAHALSGATGLTTANTVRGTNGTALNYRAGINSDSHGTARSYSATGLPPGLTVTSRTGGIISGTPNRAGVYAARVTGWQNNNATGNSYTTTVTFTIVDPVPSISVQPVPVTVAEGGTATFSVTAIGNALTYRWLHDDLEIANATNATLTIPAAKPSNAGFYQVRIQNSGGTLFSDKVRLIVGPSSEPPVFGTLPPNTTLHEGENLVLSAVANAQGAPVSTVWSLNGSILPNVSGNPLVRTNISPTHAGTYRAIATANGITVTSAPIAVVLAPPLRITNTAIDAGALKVQIPSINGRRYILEAAADPTASLWETRAQVTATGPSLQLVDIDLVLDAKFHRVRAE